MPNWCSNSLIITNPSNVPGLINKFIFENKPINCRPLIENYEKHNKKVDDEKAKKLEDPNYLINLNYGVKIEIDPDDNLTFWTSCPRPEEEEENWYNWSIENWGTKWDVSECEIYEQSNEEVQYNFDTAWGPPNEWLVETAKIYPDLKFVITYEECGCNFWGTKVFEEGLLSYEHEIPLSEKKYEQFLQEDVQYIEETFEEDFENNLEKLKEISLTNLEDIEDNNDIYIEIEGNCQDLGYYYEDVYKYFYIHLQALCKKKYKKICEQEQKNGAMVLFKLQQQSKINNDISDIIWESLKRSQNCI